MNVLDEAERRLPADADRRRALHREIVDGMREEIGLAHYAAAKGWLVKQEQAIEKTYRPFFDQLAHLQCQTPIPLPSDVRTWLKELEDLMRTGPRMLRDGLDGWDRLTPPLMPNGQELDRNLRGTWVMGIRQNLMSGEGLFNRLDMLRIYIENSIKEHQWPTRPDKGA